MDKNHLGSYVTHKLGLSPWIYSWEIMKNPNHCAIVTITIVNQIVNQNWRPLIEHDYRRIRRFWGLHECSLNIECQILGTFRELSLGMHLPGNSLRTSELLFAGPSPNIPWVECSGNIACIGGIRQNTYKEHSMGGDNQSLHVTWVKKGILLIRYGNTHLFYPWDT